MKCYAHFDKGVVFTEEALKRKVEKIIKNCWEKKNSYDDYFDDYIPNFGDFLSESDCAEEDMLMDLLLNKNVSVIETLEEDFFNWSFETYYTNLIYDEMTEMEFEE